MVLQRGETTTESPVLLEREDDLAAIDAALAKAIGGSGGLLLIEGPPGIGKTALLDELRRRASELGITVRAARAGELERGFGFGVVRQLLEALVAGADHAERARLLAGAARLSEPVLTDASAAEETGDVAFATLHGLYWLAANIAERGPLVFAVDDAQWADEPSLRFLLHLANRLAGLPMVAALSFRSGADMHRPLLNSLLVEAHPPILRPRPLSESAVGRGRAVEHRRGGPARNCAARAATRRAAIPFLLSELLGEFRREGHPADKIDPDSVGRVAPERVAVAVLLRVGHLHPQATALARAVAVLGEQARLAMCAELAGVESRTATGLANGLVDLAVLVAGEPLRFVHPVVRTAIYEDLSAADRADLHRTRRPSAARPAGRSRGDRSTPACHTGER